MPLPEVQSRSQYPRYKKFNLRFFFLNMARRNAPPHPLRDWLDSEGKKETWLADQLRCSLKHVSKILHGGGFGKSLALLIQLTTQGSVTVADLEEARRAILKDRGGGDSPLSSGDQSKRPSGRPQTRQKKGAGGSSRVAASGR